MIAHNNAGFGEFETTFYTINRSTGVATVVGSAHEFSIGEDNPSGLAFVIT